MPIEIPCRIRDENRSGWWTRTVTFPFTPYPGLRVGCFKVKHVFVCQGGLDGDGETIVSLKGDTDDWRLMRAQGWQHSDDEEIAKSFGVPVEQVTDEMVDKWNAG